MIMNKFDLDKTVVYYAGLSESEAKGYALELQEKYFMKELATIEIKVAEDDNSYVDCKVSFKSKPFERIRRITGYLVGTVDRWNDAKTSELNDRVIHGTEEL